VILRRSYIALAFASSLATGCASTLPTTKEPLVEHPRDPRTPTCRPRARLVSPAARSVGLAVIIPVATGYAMVWSEKAGAKEALRFQTVDRLGIARSPSAELVDREGHIEALALRVDGEGYAVAWSEPVNGAPHRMERLIDARGRARADVAESTATVVPEAAHRCVASGTKQVCAGPNNRTLELPAQARVVAEQLDDGPAVIAVDAEGLQLFVLSCAAR